VVFWRIGGSTGPQESRLLSLAIRLGINAAALWLASEWVTGFEIDGWQSLLATAAIFGVVNALITPVAQFLGCPLSCLTVGLFALVINAAMLALTAWVAGSLGLDVAIDGFWAAFLGALLVSFVSWLLSAFVGRPLRQALR
jgi:putative membrane protein